MRARDRVEQQRGVVDGARQRADAGQALERLGVGPGRDAPALGLDADQMRPRGGDADRAGAVRAHRGGHQAGGDRGGRAARRAAGRVVQRPRVARLAEGLALGDRPLAELGRRRLADDHGAGRAQAAGDLAVGLLAGELAATAEGRRLAGEVHVVLDGDRHAQQWSALAIGAPAVGLGSLARAALGADDAKGVEVGLGRVDAAQRGVDELDRGDLAGGDQRRLAAQAGEGEAVGLRECGRGGHLAHKGTGTCAFKRQSSRAVRLRDAPPPPMCEPARAPGDRRGRPRRARRATARRPAPGRPLPGRRGAARRVADRVTTEADTAAAASETRRGPRAGADR